MNQIFCESIGIFGSDAVGNTNNSCDGAPGNMLVDSFESWR